MCPIRDGRYVQYIHVVVSCAPVERLAAVDLNPQGRISQTKDVMGRPKANWRQTDDNNT